MTRETITSYETIHQSLSLAGPEKLSFLTLYGKKAGTMLVGVPLKLGQLAATPMVVVTQRGVGSGACVE